MVLMDCPHCGKIMSTADAACPKCSRPNKSAHAATKPDPSAKRLMTCPDCGRRMSKAAAACPECGRPNRSFEASAERVMGATNVFLGVVVVVTLVGGIAWFILAPKLTPEQKCVRDGGTVSFAQGRKVCLVPTKGYGPPKLIWLE